jgi:hypothetical protein
MSRTFTLPVSKEARAIIAQYEKPASGYERLWIAVTPGGRIVDTTQNPAIVDSLATSTERLVPLDIPVDVLRPTRGGKRVAK